MTDTRKFFIIILLMLLVTNVSSAAVELTVSPDNGIIVVRGGSINYTATVKLTEGVIFPRIEIFSIKEADKQAHWKYDFTPDNVVFESIGESKTSKLTITVPVDVPTGMYQHTVIATGYDDLGNEIIIKAEVDTYTINTNVPPIPESSTIILSSLGSIGLILIIRKYRK
jgi:uncharacterized membrane protein